MVALHLEALRGKLDWAAAAERARPWVRAVRDEPAPFWALESLLRDFPISSAEGLALMRLAEALLRVPDAETAIALTADQLGRADFVAGHAAQAEGAAPRHLAGLSASVLALSSKFLPQGEAPSGLLRRLGAQAVVAAAARAIALLGRQFVLGQTLHEALAEARAQRRAHPGLHFSFDMLGEGARSEQDALRYFGAYRDALAAIAASAPPAALQAQAAPPLLGGARAEPHAPPAPALPDGQHGGAAPEPGANPGPRARDGISIKLSALFPRYEEAQRERVFAELLPRLLCLVDDAAKADINLTLDAEESERLELSLALIDAAAAHVAARRPHWGGLGLAIQAYQTRALECVHEVARIARSHGLVFMVRLVKGAYWDSEIKRAQELGLAAYPVFTHKHHTDIAYLACAEALLGHADAVYPQFATHNAATVAAILQLAERHGAAFELQRLHGMGVAVYREVLRGKNCSAADTAARSASHSATHTASDRAADKAADLSTDGRQDAATHEVANAVADRSQDAAADEIANAAADLPAYGPQDAATHEIADEDEDAAAASKPALRSPPAPFQAQPVVPTLRIYAPVGAHRDLLAYLVRRLLENGANSSFVHQLADPATDIDLLLASPLHAATQPGLPLPQFLYGAARRNSAGIDLAIATERERLLAAVAATTLVPVPDTPLRDVDATLQRLQRGFLSWGATPLHQRAAVLDRAADRLQAELPAYCGLLVREARKTLGDAVAEVREAIDFCRYYASQAREQLAPRVLPGPTGETNTLSLRGRGVFVCISPWNFPLAIFAGQVVAALVAGNAVAAKPAEQTPAVAARFVALLHAAGLPHDALALLAGPGEVVGQALVGHALAAGVCFTGSLAVAKHIHRTLAAREGAILPLIAETGGINAMLVDSSALPEQVVDAVLQSAFRSAGQRCSALRLLCVHQSVADPVLGMLAGALRELRLGEPSHYASDVGPLIDTDAAARVQRHVERLEREAICLARTALPAALAGRDFIAPVAYEVARVDELQEEVFGPVLHVLRWGPGTHARDLDTLLAQVDALGFGLTLGVQTCIDSRALRIAAASRVGNVYVNRNMVGAVVGVQPFGGERLSGTGPKAGGPHYLLRFCSEQLVSINTAAAGGDAALIAAP